jgi:hypothetical protein
VHTNVGVETWLSTSSITYSTPISGLECFKPIVSRNDGTSSIPGGFGSPEEIKDFAENFKITIKKLKKLRNCGYMCRTIFEPTKLKNKIK